MSQIPPSHSRGTQVFASLLYELRFAMQLLLIFSFCLLTGQMGKKWLNQNVMASASYTQFTLVPSPKPATTAQVNTTAETAPKVQQPQYQKPNAKITPKRVKTHAKNLRTRPRLQQSHSYQTAAYRAPDKRKTTQSKPAIQAVSHVALSPEARHIQSVLRNDYGVVADRSYAEYMQWVAQSLENYQKK